MYPHCFMHFLKALKLRQNYWARNYNIKKSNPNGNLCQQFANNMQIGDKMAVSLSGGLEICDQPRSLFIWQPILPFGGRHKVQNWSGLPYMGMFCQILPDTFTYSAICRGNCQPGKICWQVGRLLPTTLKVHKFDCYWPELNSGLAKKRLHSSCLTGQNGVYVVITTKTNLWEVL